ncbi:response regulator [Paenibacillus sinopodophylli]|uniref:response regulator n=1 Tax=Paenibacillus sinopodophylli TaxID=1837342 RepID=UPI00148702E9|nr:response regulator [Paenibacillus sinopodophylli]
MNVLLVDDEDYVLDYLETEIPWSSLGILHVYRASSAKEALDMASRVPLSIIVSDIRMPERSGLELLSTLQREYPETKVILLSGYSDFSYAVKALQLGAADYLLKPVTEDEVLLSLKKVFVKIEDEKQKKQSLEAANDVLKLGGIRMREHLLIDLLLGKKYDSDELNRHLKALHLPFEADAQCVLVLIRIETGAEEIKREDYELLSFALMNMAEEIVFDQVNDPSSLWSCKDHHRFLIALLPIDSVLDEAELHQRMIKLQNTVLAYMKRTASILITPSFMFQHELHRQYLQALNLFWRAVGTRNNVLLTMTELERETTPEHVIKPLTRLHQSPTMQQLMESGRWEEVTSKLDFILEELSLPAYRTQQHLMEVVYYLFSSFSYIAHKQGDSFADMVNIPSMQRESYYYQSTDQIKEWAIPIIEQFQRSLKEVSSSRSHIIRQIHEYIEHNLQEDVSLTRVGEHVYLHPVYLSRLYKKETGESLSSYIARIRMEKAAHLLNTTNMKVSDIAKDVGYQKTQYFIHIFKEFYNSTPQNFRNR